VDEVISPAPPVPAPHTARASGSALWGVLVTLALFAVGFVGFLIAPWVVLAVAGLIYWVRAGRKKSPAVPSGDATGAIDAFGSGI
jgi:hypothetical protein